MKKLRLSCCLRLISADKSHTRRWYSSHSPQNIFRKFSTFSFALSLALCISSYARRQIFPTSENTVPSSASFEFSRDTSAERLFLSFSDLSSSRSDFSLSFSDRSYAIFNESNSERSSAVIFSFSPSAPPAPFALSSYRRSSPRTFSKSSESCLTCFSSFIF